MQIHLEIQNTDLKQNADLQNTDLKQNADSSGNTKYRFETKCRFIRK